MSSARHPGRSAHIAGAAAATVALLSVAGARAQDVGRPESETKPRGVLCLRKLPPPGQFGTEGKGSSDWSYEDTTEARARRVNGKQQLVVRVDGGAPVTVDQKHGGCIDGLTLDGAHTVQASRLGGGRQAARFSFAPGEGGGTVLELHYEPFYGNIQIGPPARTATTIGGTASCGVCPIVPAARKKRDVGSLSGHANSPRVRDRWPKPATVTGLESQMLELPRIDGVTRLDHGQSRVPPDQWQVAVVVRDARAVAALRARGMKVEVGEFPTAAELKDDLPERR